jgi:hypothetical protein
MTIADEPDLLHDAAQEPVEWILARFARDGYVAFDPALPAELHRAVHARLTWAAANGRSEVLVDNLLAAVPELRALLRAPAVQHVISSVLGNGFLVHPHCAAQLNPANAPTDPWHKETYGGADYKLRNHRPWWGTLFYYPQDTTVPMGPTAVLPSSQCLERLPEEADRHRTLVVGRAGLCVFLHYDLWHRRESGDGTPPRFLVKFEFARAGAPAPLEHGYDRAGIGTFLAEPSPTGPDAVVGRAHFEWLTGTRLDDLGQPSTDAARAAEMVEDPSEPSGLAAAYAVARTAGGPAVLASMLAGAPAEVARRAAYGLAGSLDEPERILAAVSSPDEVVRQLAALVVGESAPDTPAGCVAHLQSLIADPSPRVRVTAAEALGQTRVGVDAVDELCRCLRDEVLDVRHQALVALARLGPSAAHAVPHVEPLLACGDRYLEGLAVEAVARLRGLATDPFVELLMLSRWCHHGSPG